MLKVKNLTKNAEDCYTENYNTLLKIIFKDQTK